MPALSKQRSWETFVDWCRAHGLSSSPAHPWTVAAYIRTVGSDMRLDAIRRHLGYIGSMHYEKLRSRPDRHPIVQRTLESVRREREDAKKPKPPPLFQPDDFIAEDKSKRPRKARGAKTAKKSEAKPRRSLRASPKLVRRKSV